MSGYVDLGFEDPEEFVQFVGEHKCAYIFKNVHTVKESYGYADRGDKQVAKYVATVKTPFDELAKVTYDILRHVPEAWKGSVLAGGILQRTFGAKTDLLKFLKDCDVAKTQLTKLRKVSVSQMQSWTDTSGVDEDGEEFFEATAKKTKKNEFIELESACPVYPRGLKLKVKSARHASNVEYVVMADWGDEMASLIAEVEGRIGDAEMRMFNAYVNCDRY